MFAYETLLEALKARKAVSFIYHGQYRVVSPYILGKNKLMGLQTEGGSADSGSKLVCCRHNLIPFIGTTEESSAVKVTRRRALHGLRIP